MIDPSITDVAFGRDYLGGKSVKTARKVIEHDRVPHYRVNGHWLIKVSDAEAWRQERMTTPKAPNLKSMLAEISNRVLQKQS